MAIRITMNDQPTPLEKISVGTGGFIGFLTELLRKSAEFLLARGENPPLEQVSIAPILKQGAQASRYFQLSSKAILFLCSAGKS